MKILEPLLLIAFCLLLVLLALGTVGWALVSGQALSMDGLLLVLVCLVMAVIFFPLFLVGMQGAGLLGSSDSKKEGAGRKLPPPR